ncbi:MAG: hypothetical protein Q9195_000430 [Heterodermia aff. obscurata]
MGDINGFVDRSEAEGILCPVHPPVWQRLHEAAVSCSNKLALASFHQPPTLYGIANASRNNRYLRWSYHDLNLAINRLAGNLQKIGVKRGQPVAAFLYNGAEFVMAFWAAHKLGCPFVPMNPRSLVNAEEAAHMLRVARISIVLTQDTEMAAKFDALPLHRKMEPNQIKIVVSEIAANPSWTTFADLMQEVDTSKTSEGDDIEDQVIAILFTSGTTSLPKGVPHTDTTLNTFCENLSLGGSSEKDVFCSVLPNNHAMGYFYTLHFMMHGAAIVYPSPIFDAVAMVKALEEEKCTHTALVPTSLHALLEALKARGNSFRSSLVDVCLSGSSVTPDNIRQAIVDLGSKGISTGFGMTEGSPIWSAPVQNPEDLVSGDLTIAGPPAPGAHIRICNPESRTPIPRGERGEIHQTGPGLVKAYLGVGVGKDQFYVDDDGKTWFVTGDQGVMLPDKRISITGRYKDMINRGGENIAPASIETTLSRVCGVEAQVVGAPDSIAGEVPVVVLQSLGDVSVKDLQQAVLNHLGTAYMPDEVTTLTQLGLADFPKTISGKVQKSRLAELVRLFRVRRDDEQNASRRSIHDTVLHAYYKSTGITIEDLDLLTPVTNFADSISFMRVRDALRKELGFTLTFQEMTEYPNIESQIRLLQGRDVKVENGACSTSNLSGPPSLDEMSIAFGSSDEAERMNTSISKTIEAKGFNWSHDVASIIPAHDFMQVLLESELINTWNFAIAIMADGSSTQQLRSALEKALSNNPLLVSFYILDRDENPHYVSLNPSGKLWDLCLLDHGSVKTSADVQQLAIDYPFRDHATAPGPLFRCLIVHVEETKSAAMVMYVHHIVQDVSSTRLFYEDLDLALSSPFKKLLPHVDYKAWADSFIALRDSPAATASVNYHVKRLSDLHLHSEGLYPRAPLPRQAITESPDGLDYGFDAPGLLDLKTHHPGIVAAVVLKAAMALVDVGRTGYTHALFNNFEAARTRFPFIPTSLEKLNPESYEAADVNGPVMQTVCNLIEVPRSQTAIALLKCMQAEQLELTKHAHAPLRRIINALNAKVMGAGDMIMETHRTQFLTWIPGFLGEYEHLKVAQIAIRCDAGLVVVAGLGGPTATTYMLSMRWEVANYSREKTQEYVNDLQDAVLWLTAKENWDVPVSVFLNKLDKER